MKNITTFLLIVILFSCNKTKKENSIELDLSERSSKIRYSEIIDSLRYVHLENKDECLIGNVDQFIKDDTLLFLLDKQQKTLFIFSENGKFIRKLDKVGGGEGEYIATTSFCINPNTKMIHILDDTQHIILQYTYNLRFIKKLQFEFEDIIRSIGMLPNGNFIFFTPDQMPRGRDGVWEVDTLGNFVRQFREVDAKHKFSFSPFPYYTTSEGIVSFYDGFTNEIFSIENGELLKKHHCNLKQKLPDKFLSRMDGVNHEGTDIYYMNNWIAETQNHYYLRFRSNKLGDVNVFLEKNTKKVLIADLLENDFDGSQSPINIFSYNKHSMLAVVWSENSDLNPDLQLLYLKKNFNPKQ